MEVQESLNKNKAEEKKTLDALSARLIGRSHRGVGLGRPILC